jgi:protein-disulfide isomerase
MNPSGDRIVLTLPVGEQDHCLGAATAPITLVEYGDYQCPNCAQAHSLIQQLQQQLGEQLRFVYRHFPQPDLHPEAQHAAEAAEAANSQGKFWQMHDCLFANQHALHNGYLVDYATTIGLDVMQFLREMTGDVHVDRIQQNRDSGIASGVIHTPTFFINSVRHDGDWRGEGLLIAINQAQNR